MRIPLTACVASLLLALSVTAVEAGTCPLDEENSGENIEV